MGCNTHPNWKKTAIWELFWRGEAGVIVGVCKLPVKQIIHFREILSLIDVSCPSSYLFSTYVSNCSVRSFSDPTLLNNIFISLFCFGWHCNLFARYHQKSHKCIVKCLVMWVRKLSWSIVGASKTEIFALILVLYTVVSFKYRNIPNLSLNMRSPAKPGSLLAS
jgi:hypothetical protein